MRVIFMGTPQLAADILDEIARHHQIVCVYTRPDKVRGRGKRLVPSPVKQVAQELGIDVRCPATLKDAKEIDHISRLEPDVICVAAYGMILPKEVLDIPPLGCLNVHASLLPRWRGAAPIERAILAGDEYAGVCIMNMEEGLDTGDFCVSRRIPISGMGSRQLTEELAELGSRALLNALEQIGAGSAHWVRQSSDDATYAKKLGKRELWLDPEGEARCEYRKVLASSDNHPSKAQLDGRTCTICKASIANEADIEGPKPDAGELVAEGGRLFMAFDDGLLEILSLKPDGKSQMDAASYLAGARLGKKAAWSFPR